MKKKETRPVYRGDIELKINTSKKSLLEYKVNISQEDINTVSSVLQNNTLNCILHHFYCVKMVTYTQKISDKKALQIQLFQSYNKTPQDLSISPFVPIDLITEFNTQYSRYIKNIISAQSTLLGSTSKTKYTFSLGTDVEKNPFISYLNDNSDTNYYNDFSYSKNSIWFKGAYHLQYGNFKTSPSLTASFLNQSLNNILDKQSNFLIEPSLALKYKLNENSVLFSSVNFTQKPFSEEYFIIKPFFTTPRNIISSTPSLEIKKTLSYNLFYSINNLFRQFQFRLGFLYNKDNGSYFSNFNISENSTTLHYFYLPESNENMTFNLMIEKYLPVIESTIRLSSDFSISNYIRIL